MLLLVPACCQQKKRCIHFFHRLTKRGYLFVLKERTQNRSYRFVNKAAKPMVKCWIWNFCSAKYLVLLQSLRIYFYSEGGRREGKKTKKHKFKCLPEAQIQPSLCLLHLRQIQPTVKGSFFSVLYALRGKAGLCAKKSSAATQNTATASCLAPPFNFIITF